MNLHICTISLRNDFLKAIHNSLPRYPDAIWHIARSYNNPVWEQDIIKDPRVRIHNLTCEDKDTSFKMNYIFKYIIDNDPNSYFCLLDDDTVFHERMYSTYKRYSASKGKFMGIGKQLDKFNKIRLPATLPHECAIDSGNVLCHSHVLGVERWPDGHWDDKFHADFVFWNTCYRHFGLRFTELIQDPISIYNMFSQKPDTLDYAR